MLEKQELESLKNLLESADESSFNLGLALLEQNITQSKPFLAILVCQKILLANNNEELKLFLKNYKNQDELYQWEQKLAFISWAAEGKKFLSGYMKSSPQTYQSIKNNFLSYFDLVEATLLKSNKLEEIYYNLASHFLYKENDYIVASHFAADLFLRLENFNTVGILIRLLIYYHFPNGYLLFLYPKMQHWINNFLEKNAALPQTKITEWRHFLMSWQDALLDDAIGNRENAKIKFINLLDWANKIPNLLEAGKAIYSDIYDKLSFWAAEENDLKMAKFYLEKSNYKEEPNNFVKVKSTIFKLEGKVEKAVAILFEWIKKRPNEEIYYVQLAEIYIENRKFKQAVDVMIMCVAHSPQSKIHILRLIDYLKLSKMADKHNLIIHYQKVISDIDESVGELENLFYL